MNLRTCAIGAALLSLSASALAINAPSDLRVIVTASYVAPPELLLGFNNNEVQATFEFEVMIDGVSLGPSGIHDSLHCVRSSANANDCNGIRDGHNDPGWGAKGWRAVVLAPPASVKFDTEYCFRVQVLDRRDSNNRSAWAPWACAHTPPLPQRPTTAPPMPKVTLLEGASSGLGRVGPANPARVLIEWDRNLQFEGWYAIERARAVSGTTWQEVGRVVYNELTRIAPEFVEAIQEAANVPGLNNRTNYRVCAANIGGKICSTASSFPPAALKLAVDSTTALSRTPPRPVTVAQTGVPAALRIAAPQILAPAPGGSVVQGQLRLQVSAPGIESSQAEVEFSRQEARPQRPGDAVNAAPVTVLWKTPMAALAKGALVPPGEGPTQAGVWVARVRSIRGATPDPWGEPVSFTVSVPVWVKAATTATLTDTQTRAIAAPLAASPLQKASTAMGAKPAASLDWGKPAPSAFSPAAPRGQP